MWGSDGCDVTAGICIFTSGVSFLSEQLLFFMDLKKRHLPTPHSPAHLVPNTPLTVAVRGSPESGAVCSWTWKEKKNFWLLWPLALKLSLFYDSVLLFITQCRSHAPTSNASHARSSGRHRLLSLTLAETIFTWHWTRWWRSKEI